MFYLIGQVYDHLLVKKNEINPAEAMSEVEKAQQEIEKRIERSFLLGVKVEMHPQIFCISGQYDNVCRKITEKRTFTYHSKLLFAGRQDEKSALASIPKEVVCIISLFNSTVFLPYSDWVSKFY